MNKTILSLSLLGVITSANVTAQTQGLEKDAWSVTGFVFKEGTSEQKINTIQYALEKNISTLKHSPEYIQSMLGVKLYTRYRAAGYTFLIGPFPTGSARSYSLKNQYNEISLFEPLSSGKEELDLNVESLLLSYSETQPGDANINSFWENGITGSGFSGGIMDSGVDIEHSAFSDKDVTVLGSSDESPEDYNRLMKTEWLKTAGSRHLRSAHGTAVAGAIVANSAESPHHGIAKNANLVTGYAGSASDTLYPAGDSELAKLFRELKSANLTMSTLAYMAETDIVSLNYSYGNGRILRPRQANNQWHDWSFWARYFDAVSYEQDFLYAKSAGNDGSKYPDGSSAPSPQSYSLSRPGDNFNGLTVANVDTTVNNTSEKTVNRADHAIRSTSSRGPTTTGRRKPDIAAPGHNTRTAAPDPDNHEYYGPYKDRFDAEEYKEYDSVSVTRLATGTSLASPHVAGAIILVRQALEEQNRAPETRYSPLVKAVLINSADNSSTALSEDLPELCSGHWCPSVGWGYMDLTQAYQEYTYAQQFDVTAHNTKAFKVQNNTDNAKATLVWEHTRFDQASSLTPMTLTMYVNGQQVDTDVSQSQSALHNVLQVQSAQGQETCIEMAIDTPSFTRSQQVALASNHALTQVSSCQTTQ